MKRKIFYPIALVAVLAFVLIACRKETIDIFVENITLDMSEATLEVNGTLTLVATVEPDDAFNQLVRWTSSNKTVATVNDNGVVTALAPGSTTIIVATEDGGLTATCTVTVIRQVTGITISPKPLSLTVGNNATLTATFTPPDASDKIVVWSSDKPTVATVDNNGVVIAVSEGTATIKAISQQDATKYDECVVTVTKAIVPVVAVTLSQTTASLTTGTTGNTITLVANVLPATATVKTVSWSSTNTSVATVNNGVVTAVSKGSAIIVVATTDGNHEAFCNVTVNDPVIPVEDLFIEPASLTFNVGDAPVTLIRTIQPANATNQNVIWTSSKPTVATVTNGTVTPVAAGTATIIATAVDGGKTATCNVTVNEPFEPVVSVSLPATLTINGSEIKTLIASILPLGATNKDVTWTSSAPTVATVSGTGLTVDIIPVAPAIGYTADRTTTITVTTEDGGKVATCTVTVKYVDVSSLTLNKTSLVLDEGNFESLEATILPVNASIKTVKWGSSNNGIASVSSTTGVVMAIASGSATITATSDGNSLKTADCAVTVN